jgi:hypothetical protein
MFIAIRNCSSQTNQMRVICRDTYNVVGQKPFQVGPSQRYTLYVNDFVSGSKSITTELKSENSCGFTAERASYDGPRATSSGGPGVDNYLMPWLLAEGYTGFDTYIAQTQFSANIVDNVLTFFGTTGPIKSYTIANLHPKCRWTVHVNDCGLGIRDFSSAFYPGALTPNQPYMERSSYYGNWATSSEGCIHESSTYFYFAEGYTGHDVYFPLLNDWDSTNTATFLFTDEWGSSKTVSITVPAGCRRTLYANQYLSGWRNKPFSVRVKNSLTSFQAVERSSYFN